MLLKNVPPFFKERRDLAWDAMTREEGNDRCALLLPANPIFYRNPDVMHPYRQESNFYYLSGFEEPESFFALVPSDSKRYRSVLFVQPRDPERELWDGERYGVDGALRVFGVDEAYEVSEFEKKFPDLIRHCETVFYRMGPSEGLDRKVLSVLEKTRISFGRSGRGMTSLKDPKSFLGELRLFKRPEEIEFLREAARISSSAHVELIRQARPGTNEAELDAFLDYHFRKNGCKRSGYGNIVAGGASATCLHYVSNNDNLKEGDVLLVDAGGEYEYQTADITRTSPVGKAFSREQAEIYDLVLRAQEEAIALIKPGLPYKALHEQTTQVLVDGLLSLGVLKGSAENVIKEAAHRKFFPHGTGHWLGMDVHDVGLYQIDGQSRELEPGMVFTVEPGLYFRLIYDDYPEKYRGIGIRIEDNILVTKDGCEILNHDVPKEREEIEALKQ